MSPLADRSLELQLRDRIRFGVGAIEALPELVATAGDGGGTQAFIVTDPGVLKSGVIDRVRGVLEAAGIRVGVYAQVEPNPGTSSVLRGNAALTAFGIAGSVIIPVGGGSSMDTAKAISLHAVNVIGSRSEAPRGWSAGSQRHARPRQRAPALGRQARRCGSRYRP